MANTRKLSDYNAKRDFSRTPEPEGKPARARKHNLQFLVQKHAARRLHYDLRLEWDGVLWSWAVTRGPSADPGEKRLAVRTEDHPLSYAEFEGSIQKGEYGGGTVMLWDEGTWEPLHDPAAGLQEGKLHFRIAGERMKGGWALVRMRNRDDGGGKKRENWLLIKERDDEASEDPDGLVSRYDHSVVSGRSMEAIAAAEPVTQKRRSKAGTQTSEKAGKTTSAARPARGHLLPNPPFHQPQLATLVTEAPQGDQWLHETKFDGYRCQASLGKAGTRLYTRTGLDWSHRFQDLLPAFDSLPCRSALIDGEVVSGTGGTSAFSSLQHDLKSGGPLQYFAFDLLFLDGQDLRKLPLLERKQHLQTLLESATAGSALHYSTHIIGHGPQIVGEICRSGGEGIICKRADASYRATRSREWLKVKCSRRQEFVVGGYSPSTKPGRPFASLLLGSFEEGELRYRGRVGTGFSKDALGELDALFQRLVRKTSPFASAPARIGAQARWLRPELVVEVDFAEFTADGHVRHGVYMGRREDKPAADITPEHRTPLQAVTKGRIGNIRLTSGDREIFPGTGTTKYELAAFYHAAAERLLAIAGKRPLSLMRCPQGLAGQCFFQKHAGKGFPDTLKQIDIEERDGDVQPYLYISSRPGFVAAAQMGTIEFHIWGSRVDRLEKPDRLVFDLDPDESLTFSQVRDAAVTVKTLLEQIGLRATPLLTGGKGIHVCVPLKRFTNWETLKIFARTVAELLAHSEPERFTANMSKARRKGRIFIDWLRNERGATAIVPYSVRARPGAGVATPLTWKELAAVKSADAFHIADVLPRLQQPCPYLQALEDPQLLGEAVIGALDDLLGSQE